MTEPDKTDGDAGKGRARRGGGTGRTEGGAPAPLAAALRELTGGIETEVGEITRLSSQIDEQVAALNDLRADVVARLLHLDALRAAAGDSTLGAYLDEVIAPTLPQQTEDFPERLYGT